MAMGHPVEERGLAGILSGVGEGKGGPAAGDPAVVPFGQEELQVHVGKAGAPEGIQDIL